MTMSNRYKSHINMKRVILLILFAVIYTEVYAAFVSHQIDKLRCEYQTDPSGVDILNPRLNWIMIADLRGDMQTAYQLIVSSTLELLEKNEGDMWDTGKVNSNQSIHITYQGKPLQSGSVYFWKVRVWNISGQVSGWSKPARWSMGLLSHNDWKNAQWIAYKNEKQWKDEWKNHKEKELKDISKTFTIASWPWLTGKDSSIFTLYEMANPNYDPSPLLRKEFSANKQIHSARLYICGLGYYEAFINGKRVGDHVLDPAWTNYEQRSMYATYDVSDLLRRGQNAIGVMLGRGQYNPLCNDIWGLYKSAWVDQPKLIALLNIEYNDGTKKSIITDKTWKTDGGPVIYDDTRHGELYDARLEQDGWSQAAFNDTKWKVASEVSFNTRLESQMIPPVRCFSPLHPIRTISKEKGITIYDIGENIAGWANIKVRGSSGKKVLVEYCETPSDAEVVSNLTPSRFKFNIGDTHYASFYDKCVNVRQQNGYILKGKGQETIECHFSYKGFRYIRITAEEGVSVEQVSGIPVHTDIEIAGNFTCSDPLVNRIQQNAVNSLLSNYHSIATDCPHREKQGWTADNYMSAQAAMYNFNMATFYSKWLMDLAGTQNKTGGLCSVAPATGYDMGVSTAWPAAIVLIPWDLYIFYADKQAMEMNYDVMHSFAKSSLQRQVPGKPEIINEALGDWLAPIMEMSDTIRNNTMAPPEGHTLYGTASHFLVVKRLSQTSRVLGKENEATLLKEWAGRIAQSFNNEFYDVQSGVYHGDKPAGYRQAANVVPLQYGLVPKESEKIVTGHLIDDIHSKGDKLATGFLGTMALMEYLPLVDPRLAYILATQKKYPGWGYMIEQGARSMWESWDGYDSRNHTPFCLISAYFYKHLAGIQFDPANPGFKQFIINPSLENDLKYADAYYDSLFGRIKSSWKKENGTFILNCSVPVNTTALIHLPAVSKNEITESGTALKNVESLEYIGTSNGKFVYKAGSGNYSFQCKIEK